MARKKNLERAVVLGLLLSTSIYGSALAAGVSIGDFVDGKTGIITIDTDTETVVNGNGTQGGDSDTTGNSLFSYVNGTRYNNKVSVSNGLGLTFNNVALNNAYIQSNGKLTINNIADGMKAGLYLDANITAAELEINATGKDAKGIYAYNDNRNEVNSGDILINVANGVRITSDSDGIFTEADISGEVDPTNSIDIKAGSLEVVTYSRGGIYNNGVNDVENHIRINVGEGLVSVTSGDDTGRYGGIINKNVGDTTIDAGTIMVTAKESNGVLSTNGTINLNAGHNNIINGGTNAVYNNGTGTINIRAEKKDGDISTLADYNDYDNVLIGGENGVKSDSTGTTNVIADNNNIIAGTTNGILSDGAGTITVTAGNDNIIGQYTYKDENNSDVIVTSNTGINVTEGTVNVTAGGSNSIYGTNIGVSVRGETSKVAMTGVDNIITVNDSNVLVDNTSGIYVSDGGTYQIVKNNGNNTNINVTAHVKNAYGINAEKQGFVDIDTNDFNLIVNSYYDSAVGNGSDPRGINSKQGNVDIDADGSVNINVINNIEDSLLRNAFGITVNTQNDEIIDDKNVTTYGNAQVTIDASDITINNIKSKGNGNLYAVFATSNTNDDTKATVNLHATGKDGIKIGSQTEGSAYGISAAANSDIIVTADNGGVVISAVGGSETVSQGITASSIDIAASIKDNVATKVSVEGLNTNISGTYEGIYAGYGKTYVDVVANNGNNIITGGTIGVRSENGADVGITADSGSNYVTTDNGTYGIYTTNAPGGNITSNTFTNGKDAVVVLDAKNNIIDKSRYGIYGYCYTDTDLIADVQNSITANRYGIYATFDTEVTLSAGDNNYIASGDTANGFGNAYAVYAFDNGGFKGSNVLLDAVNKNYLLGAVYANGNDEQGNATTVTLDSKENVIRSYAVINNAGDLNTNEEFKDKSVVSALYAQNGANIELTGENYIGTYADNTDKDTLERTVWAYNEGTIDITGAAQIGTDRYDSSPNSADVAIAAGTATNLTKDIVDNYDETYNPRATVTVNYDDFKDENGVSINKSNISGDILSAYAGLVDISTDNSEAGININGNLLAGNNGILSVDLGKGGTLIGRADDYGDAGYVGNIENEGDTNEHQNFYNPEFSSTIYSGGRVDLEMGAGSTWFVTGQSWITSINTENAQGDTQDTRATIDLTTLYENDEADATTAHALTVYDFKGDADFKMNLSGDRTNSDMLYMKHADGTYRINLVDAVTTDEINSDQNGNEFSGLRFATVGSDSNVNFVVGSYDNGGAFNVEYEVGTDEYGGTETAHENDVYNGSSLNSGKPGSDMVDGFFGSDGEPVSSDNNTESGISTMDLQAANNIMLMSEEAATLDETAAAANDAADYNATNHKIIARLGEEISDTGKTILNMSRANYSNAIYMDRLNKRLGEARYINSEEDEGMWVRIRHDRIGKDDAYRSQNTMYELGYDQKQECDNGERRVGMAIDYMHGDTGYDQIAGKGEIDRYGLWLYDTWMGDKGHYADYVAKWGHLSNDFEVYTMQNGDKVTGDYSNNVFSVSAEYGRKKDIGNDWYFEPQVQAQLARVTGADYTTNQGTKVSVDGINSLIGRAGFRLGKDFGEEKQSTVYIKADVLHEFLGDQDVRVLDKSSDNKWAGISYENEGTWYDVGFGFATQMSKNSYAFMDFEKSFGNDNDETYQINVGMQWSF